MTCKTCKYLDVPPDASGRIVPRAHRAYKCAAPISEGRAGVRLDVLARHTAGAVAPRLCRRHTALRMLRPAMDRREVRASRKRLAISDVLPGGGT